MNKLFLPFLALLGMNLAVAQAPTVSWTNPTTNTNGTLIPDPPAPGSLESTRVAYGTCNGDGSFGIQQGEVVVLQPTVSVLMSQLTLPGTYCFVAWAKITTGAESDPSNVVSKTIVNNPPPVLKTYTKNAFQNYAGKIVKIGTVALNVTCGVDAHAKSPSTGAELYFIPRSSVHFTRKENGSQTFGVCR